MSGSPRRVLIGLGASLGDRRASLALAVRLLDLQPHTRVLRCSRIYRTPPWGGVAGNPFLNAAVLLRSSLTPHDLLGTCQAIERRVGRRPGLRWGDRVLDLDLLWIEGLVLDSDEVALPHPRIAERSFVVRPIEDVSPGAIDPRSGRSFLQQHLARGPEAALPRPTPAGILAQPRDR
jgi:2-amino-4-hydroxy-6-hydroxymethyldihydropteridine diphosphokinase